MIALPCAPLAAHPTLRVARLAARGTWHFTGRLSEVWRCRHCGFWHFATAAPSDAGIRYATFAGRRRRS